MDVDQEWGPSEIAYGSEKLGLGLEASPEDGLRVLIQFSSDGVMVDQQVALPSAVAEEYARAVLELVARAQA